MAYATRQDLVDRFGATELIQLTDRVNRPASTVDDTVVGRAIADAEALIDGYLAKRYALPLAEIPPILTRMACDIARFFLHGKAAEKDGPVDRANTAAISWLRDVSRGVVELEVGAGETPAPIGGGMVRTSASERVMRRDSLRGM
jgi:phage gp36-like protein